MKCIFSVFVAVFLFACGNNEQAKISTLDLSELQKIAADTPNFTRIQWIDSVYNFGTIDEGEQIQIQFKFKNIGNKPLYLTDVKAGCGCTTPNYSKQAIAVGDVGFITAAFDSKNQIGEITKYILVKTNTHNGTEHKLVFKGMVNKN